MTTQAPTLLCAIVLLAAAAAPQAAEATILSFTGTRENVNPITDLGVGRCGLGRRTGIVGDDCLLGVCLAVDRQLDGVRARRRERTLG